ncbi:MAG: transcriptional regulator [Bacteroidales bacterium 36-12]|jgi:ribosome-binding protein aMBF1 (putative translation factor)|nr:MAG: transcriptional regulator [Bacteroidales bacterium 36-12]
MKTKDHLNNHQIVDFDAVLDEKFGKVGSSSREEFRKEAYVYYMGQIIHNARKSEKITQAELASRIGVDKSYISKIENGDIEPGTGTFYRIIQALGLRFDVVKPVCY